MSLYHLIITGETYTRTSSATN